jgi:hypothetical protein
MVTVTFPDSALSGARSTGIGPAAPVLGVDVPDGWATVPAADGVVALAEPQPADGFRSNVVFSVTRFPAGYSIGTAAAALDLRLAELDQVKPITALVITVDDIPGVVREVAYVDRRAGTIVQSHLALVTEHDGVADLLHATASCGATRARAELGTLRHALTALTVTT